METDDLAGTAAIVTGASRGLGRAFALDLVAAGANVTITARSAEGLEETAASLPGAESAFEIVAGDVTDPAVAGRAVTRTMERFGSVDVLVNNAGTMAVGSVADIDLDDWWSVMDVNVRGPLIWTKAVLPWMRAARAGRIINVSSQGAYTQHPYASAYCASKAAVSQLTSCLAAELADDGIIVLAFGPAALTGLARSLFETEAMPEQRRQFYETYFTANPDELLRNTLALFGFLVQGGGDHLSGHYVGSRVDGFDTPDDLRGRLAPT